MLAAIVLHQVVYLERNPIKVNFNPSKVVGRFLIVARLFDFESGRRHT